MERRTSLRCFTCITATTQTWFRDAVKDPYLADQAERIAHRRDLQPAETRGLIVSVIEGRYTLPE